MKIYLDALFILNLSFDFILLFLVSYILKRKTKWFRLLMGSLIGSLSIFFLFLPLSSLSLFLLKIITSITMIIVSFGYKDTKYFTKNFIYLYVASIMLGGILYFLEITFSYKNTGLIFINNGLSVNFIILLIISPFILYLYFKENRNYKNTYSLIHKIEFSINNKQYIYNAYLDTGNKLVDPYKKRPILLVYDKKLKFNYENSILVPYKTLEHEGIIKCKKINKYKIDDKIINKSILIGISKDKFNIEGIECILPNIIKEDLN